SDHLTFTVLCFFFFTVAFHHPHLHSFPTRRSSDLQHVVEVRLEQLKLAAGLNGLVPAVVPMPREGAIVEVGALRRLAKWLERRIGLPFGIEEGRREHGDPLALPERAAHVLAPPVVFARRE